MLFSFYKKGKEKQSSLICTLQGKGRQTACSTLKVTNFIADEILHCLLKQIKLVQFFMLITIQFSYGQFPIVSAVGPVKPFAVN